MQTQKDRHRHTHITRSRILLDAVQHLFFQNSKNQWAAILSNSSRMKTTLKNMSRPSNVFWDLDPGAGLISFSATSQAKLPRMSATQKICVGCAQYSLCTPSQFLSASPHAGPTRNQRRELCHKITCKCCRMRSCALSCPSLNRFTSLLIECTQQAACSGVPARNCVRTTVC